MDLHKNWLSVGVTLLTFCLLVMLIACHGISSEKAATNNLLEKIKKRGRIVAGVTFDSKPFGYLDTDGKLKGYDIDLIHELANRILGSPDAVEFKQVFSSTRIIAVNSGIADMVAATMTITPEREEVIDFSNPYYIAGQGILVQKASPTQQVSDLQHKKILFVFGTTSEGNMKKRVPQAKYKGFMTLTQAFSELKKSHGDALTSDDTVLSGLMSLDCNFRLLEERLSKEPYGLGFKQDKDSHSTDALRQVVNKALQEMATDGTLEKLKARWVGPDNWSKGC